MSSVGKELSPYWWRWFKDCIGIVPRGEVLFASPRKWRFDFAFPAMKVAIEINGGAWIGGRHNRALGAMRDWEKLNEAQLLDWIVLQFTPQQMKSLEAVPVIKRAIQSRIGQRS